LFKHLLLILCLEKLQEKDSAFLAIDCHAGAGKYWLGNCSKSRFGEIYQSSLKLEQNPALVYQGTPQRGDAVYSARKNYTENPKDSGIDMQNFLASESVSIKTYDERGSAENAAEIADKVRAKGSDFEQVLKSKEANQGIIKLLSNPDFVDFLPKSYLQILAKTNCCKVDELSNRLKIYPGSPLLIKNFLRKQDRAFFAESENSAYLELKRNFSGNRQIQCRQQDGYLLLKSALPPLEKRVIALLDPAFEKLESKISADYDKSIEALKWAKKRFANGIFLFWYPLIAGEEDLQKRLYQEIQEIGFEKTNHFVSDFDEFLPEKLSQSSSGFADKRELGQDLRKIAFAKEFQGSFLSRSESVNRGTCAPQKEKTEESSKQKLDFCASPVGNKKRMNRCAIFIFNIPWQVEEKFLAIWSRVAETLRN
jgi:23S rRNA A2030 N6-methylase RlmJ